jgi:hypothetical protein
MASREAKQTSPLFLKEPWNQEQTSLIFLAISDPPWCYRDGIGNFINFHPLANMTCMLLACSLFWLKDINNFNFLRGHIHKQM